MAGKTIVMSILKQILLQRSNGISLQTISKTLKISRNTVKKYLRLIDERGYDPAELLKMSQEDLHTLVDLTKQQQNASARWKNCSLTSSRNCSVPASIEGFYGASTAGNTPMAIATRNFVSGSNNGWLPNRPPCIWSINQATNSSWTLRAKSYRSLIRRPESKSPWRSL